MRRAREAVAFANWLSWVLLFFVGAGGLGVCSVAWVEQDTGLTTYGVAFAWVCFFLVVAATWRWFTDALDTRREERGRDS